MDKQRKRDVIREAVGAIKYDLPEVTAAWDRLQEASDAAGLDLDPWPDDEAWKQLPAEVQDAYRHYEALESVLEQRIGSMLEMPLLSAVAPGTTMEDRRERRSAMDPKNIKRLYDAVADVLSGYLGFRDDDEPNDPYLTIGDLRDLFIILEHCRDTRAEKDSADEQHADA